MKQYNIQASIRVTEFFEDKIPTTEKLGIELEKFLRTQVPGAFRNEVLVKVEVREVPAVVNKQSTKPKTNGNSTQRPNADVSNDDGVKDAVRETTSGNGKSNRRVPRKPK